MNRFDECLTFVLRHEGGYTNNPLDRGGATNRGITQATLDEWRISKGLPRSPVSGLSGQEISAIYQKRYWVPSGAGALESPLDLVVFDAAVQHGPTRSVKWLQRAVSVVPDGIPGPQTWRAVSSYCAAVGTENLVEACLKLREGFYHVIVANDPKQVVFSRGWANRMADLYAEVSK